jgi:hypothetical protein
MSSTLSALAPVEQTKGEYWVINATIGPFCTHAAACRWIDEHTDSGRTDTNRYNRIRIAFSKCSAESNSNSRA